MVLHLGRICSKNFWTTPWHACPCHPLFPWASIPAKACVYCAWEVNTQQRLLIVNLTLQQKRVIIYLFFLRSSLEHTLEKLLLHTCWVITVQRDLLKPCELHKVHRQCLPLLPRHPWSSTTAHAWCHLLTFIHSYWATCTIWALRHSIFLWVQAEHFRHDWTFREAACTQANLKVTKAPLITKTMHTIDL